ncbi:MAG: Mth938-like domain-containing protein [Gammaproteobacteria bacterium]
MNITQDFGNATYLIRGYDAHEIRINDSSYTRSVLITPDFLDSEWPPQRVEEIATKHIEAIAALKPEVVVLGTGAKIKFPAREISHFFLERGVGVEIMDTPAACRTYNILMSEGRNVAAGLIVGEADG